MPSQGDPLYGMEEATSTSFGIILMRQIWARQGQTELKRRLQAWLMAMGATPGKTLDLEKQVQQLQTHYLQAKEVPVTEALHEWIVASIAWSNCSSFDQHSHTWQRLAQQELEIHHLRTQKMGSTHQVLIGHQELMTLHLHIRCSWDIRCS